MPDYDLPVFVGKVHEALALFRKMQEEGIKPGKVCTWKMSNLLPKFLSRDLCNTFGTLLMVDILNSRGSTISQKSGY